MKFLVVATLFAASTIFGANGQRIDLISPRLGSTFGGTRVTIVGSGFDIRGRSNDVFFGNADGGVFCDPVPNECHSTRILCLTAPYKANGTMPISVRSNGVVASCNYDTAARGCTFEYTADRTPSVTALRPEWISKGTTPITVTGTGFDRGDGTVGAFDFSAWFGDEERCDLGANSISSTSFVCNAENGIFPGSNRFSLQLGSRGNARVADTVALTVIPSITSVSMAEGSTEGGQIVTIAGNFFSRTARENEVTIHDAPCIPTSATPEQVVCVTTPHTETTTAAATTYTDGVKFEYWGGRLAADATTVSFRGKLAYFSPSITMTLDAFGGALPVPREDYAAVQYTAWYLAPQSGVYTITAYMDDMGELWVGTGEAPVDMVRQYVSDDVNYNDRLIIQRTSYGTSSANVTLVAGQRYWVQMLMLNGGGAFSSTVTFKLPDGTSVVNPSSGMGVAVKPWASPVVVKSRGMQALYSTDCQAYGACDFNFKAAATPVITSVSPATGIAGTAITLVGTGLSTNANVAKVQLGAFACTVTSATATQLVFTVPAAAPAGTHPLLVSVVGSGNARVTSTFDVKYTVTSANNANGYVAIIGSGLSVDASRITVTLAGTTPCTGVSVVDGEIRCVAPASVPTGEVSVAVDIAEATTVVAVLSFAFDQVNNRPGTTTAVKAPTLFTKTATLFTRNPIALAVPEWTFAGKASVSVTVGGKPCEVTVAQGSVVNCNAAAFYEPGAYAVAATKGTETVQLGNLTIREIVSSVNVNHLSTEGGNVIDIYHSGTAMDTPDISSNAIAVTYRGIPCKSVVRRSFTTVRCYLDDASLTASPALPTLASFSSATADVMLGLQTTGAVSIKANGFYIPAGATLFTRRSFSTNIRITAEVTPSAATGTCIRLSGLSSDPSAALSGFIGIGTGARFTVARGTWQPTAVASKEVELTAGVKNVWRLDITSGYGALYIDGTLVANINAAPLQDGFVGFGVSCQDISVENLKIEDLTAAALTMTINGRQVTMADEPIVKAPTGPTIGSAPNTVQVGSLYRMTIGSSVATTIYLFPADATTFQVTPSTLMLCASATSQSTDDVGTIWSACTTQNDIPAGQYIVRYRASDNGFIPTQRSLTVTPRTTSIAPTTPSYNGAILNIAGYGFTGNTADFTVTVGDVSCPVTAVTHNRINCELPAATADTARGPFAVTVSYKGAVLGKGEITYKPLASSPRLTRVAQPSQGGNDFFTIYGTNIATTSGSYATIGGEVCSLGWGSSTYFTCRLRTGIPAAGSYAVRYHVNALGYASTVEGLVANITAGFSAVTFPTAGTNGGVSVTVTGQNFAVDAGFATAASYNFGTASDASAEIAKWSVAGGIAAMSTCGSVSGFGGASQFNGLTVASRSAITGLPSHTALAVSFDLFLAGNDANLPIKVTVDGVTYEFLDVEQRPAFGGSQLLNQCVDNAALETMTAARTFVVPHTAATASISIAVPSYYGNRQWMIRSYAVKTGAAVHSVTIGAAACPVTYSEPARIVCTAPAQAAGAYAVAVSANGNALECIGSQCALTYSDDAVVSVNAATFASIAGTSTGASLTWGDTARATTVDGANARITVSGALSDSWVAAGASQQLYFKEDGFRGVSFVLSGTVMFGLSSGAVSAVNSYADIDYAWYRRSANTYYQYESGDYISDLTGGVNSVLEIRVEDDDSVTYLIDDIIAYRSSTKAQWPLRIDASLASTNSYAEIQSINFNAGYPKAATKVPVVLSGVNIPATGAVSVTVNDVPALVIRQNVNALAVAVDAATAVAGATLSVVVSTTAGVFTGSLVLSPAVTGVSIATGNTNGNHLVTVRGSGFTSAPTVTIGSVPCAVQSFTFDSIVCFTGASAAAANLTVAVTVGAAVSKCLSSVQLVAQTAFSAQCPVYSYVAPTVTAASATYANGLVTVTGTGFLFGDTATIAVGSYLCTQTTVTETAATCTLPATFAADSYNVILSFANRGGLPTQPLTIPVTAALSTSTIGSLGGARVTVTGAAFGLAATLKNGATDVCASTEAQTGTSFVCVTAPGTFTSVTAVADTGAASAALTLNAAAGNSPTISAVTPATIRAFAPVTITGANFEAVSAVAIGGASCEILSQTSTVVLCRAPATAAGAVAVSIASSARGASAAFNGAQSALAVSGVLGGKGAVGARITVTGSGFAAAGTYAVALGDYSCADVQYVDASQITCVVSGPSEFVDKSLDVAVTFATAAASAFVTKSVQYAHTVVVNPTIASVSPTAGTKAGGTVLTIVGTGFDNNPQNNFVTVGGVRCMTASSSSTQLTCEMGAITTGTSGAMEVAVTTKGLPATSTGTFTATLAVSAVSPSTAVSVEGGLPITITGEGFPASTAFTKMSVTVGGIDCPIVSTSTTAIVCTVGASPRPILKTIETTQLYPLRNDSTALIRVTVNNTVADIDDDSLKIEFAAAATPTITGAVPATAAVHQGTVISIAGTGFAASGNVVELLQQGLNGLRSGCTITSESATAIVCKADLVSFGSHFVQVNVPSVGYAKTQLACPAGQFLTCDGQCLSASDCSYTDWGIFNDCETFFSVLAADAFCHSNGGSDRVSGKFRVDSGKVLDLNCPMYSCEAQDCNTTITIGGRGEVVSTCGVDPNGFMVDARASITAIVGPKASSIYGGARLAVTGTNLGLDSVFVIGGGAYCVPIAVDGDTVTCETVAVKAAATGLSFAGTHGGVAIDCPTGVCSGFSYIATGIPTIASVTPLRSDSQINYVAGTSLTITGSGFSATAADNVITAGGESCVVTSASESQVVCTIPAIANGDYALSVRVAATGLAAPLAAKARVRPTISSIVSPGSGTLGGATVTVIGSGLTSLSGRATYSLSSCGAVEVVNASLTKVVFLTPACGTSTGRSVAFSVDGNTATVCTGCTVKYVAASSADVAIVTATTVQISSTAALNAGELSVRVGNDVCTITSATANTFQCTLPATHAAGDYPIVLVGPNGRFAVNGVAATATYPGQIDSISPAIGSLGGEQVVTIAGSGFATDASKMTVRVAGAYCAVSSATATQIVCTTAPVLADATGAVNITLSAPVGSGNLVGASYTYSSANTPVLTSVSPYRGSTAGGTMLTIVGTRLSTSLTVSINGVVCTQTQAERDATTATTYYCTTGALATSRNAILKAVDSTAGAAANTLSYDYIDLWSRWTTWGNTPPPQAGDSAVISEGQTIMMDYNAPRLFLILVMGHLMFDDTKDITLEATYIMVNFGRFTIGTPEAPYVHNAVIRLFGDRLTPEIPVHGAKVLALRHGAMDIHGIPRHPTFTKLAATAPRLATSIKVRGPVDWQVGEEIVITTTDFKMEHSEPRTITSVTGATSAVVTIGISEPLYYGHNGEKECFDNGNICIEEIADVMLLTRNIKIMGDNRTQSLGFGGTAFIMPMGQNSSMYARISYTEFVDVGQQYIVGRYPVHFHVTGTLNNSYVKGNAVHRSLNRAFSIHGVNNNTYVDNVAYDIQGHAYFIEDGNEMYNNITHNIAALVHTSTSNLNTDLTPAAFWCVSTKNILTNNIAAGSAAYGFWISPFHPNPTGPGTTTSLCPSAHPIVQFENNEAHAAKKYGLNIFQFLWPKQKECDFNGPDAPGVIKNHFSWKNKIHGVSMAHSEVGEIGAVTFDNLVSANNGEDHEDASAFWVEHIKAGNMTFGIRKATLIAQTSNAPHTSIHTRRGINLPLGDNFFAEDVTFVNYQNENYGIEPQRWAERMSFCFPWGWEALFRRTKWVNTPTNKMRMRFVHHGIINDEDGTFGSGIANTQILPQSSILDPALCKFVAGSPIVSTAACTSAHKVRRFGLANVNEVYSDQLFSVDDREEIVPQITRQYSMSIPANKVITIAFQSAYNPSKFDWTANDRFRQAGEKNIFQTVYKEVRAVANATFGGVRATMMNRRPTLQDTANGYYFGDKMATALLIAPTTGVTIDASTCAWSGCPIEPLEAAALGGPCKPWEQASSWVSGAVPAEGAALRVNYTESICLSIPGKTYRLRSLYLGGKLEVNSSFCKAGEKITLYVEKYIHIRGGILQAGSELSPLQCEFEIIIGPVDFGNMGASTVVPFSARSLVLESGDISMYGAERTRIAYLTVTSSANTKVIRVDRDVNWKVGDTLAIAQTRREAPYTGTSRTEESEDMEIAAIDGRDITLTVPLKYTHFGAPAEVLNGVEYSIGAEVICLTRNIKITGGHKRGDVLEYNLGWNFHVGCTSDILAGCGNGDSRLIGFPMGPLKPGSVRMDGVQMDDIGQEGSIHAALVFDGLVTSTTELNARTSFVRNCAFNRVRAIGITIHPSTNTMELSNNVLYDVSGDGIRVGSQGNTLDGNIILKNSFVKPLCKKMYDATVKPDCVGAAFRLNYGNIVTNNIAASGDGAGFMTVGEPCGSTFSWSNNFAVRHQDGLVINDILAVGGTPDYHWTYSPHSCRVVGGVNAFSNSDQGIATWYAEGDVTVRNAVVVDNMFGITALLFNKGYDRGERELQYVVEDSTVAGHWRTGQPCSTVNAFKCRSTMVDSLEWCSTIYNPQMGKRVRGAGILEAVFVDSSYEGRNKGESKFLWIEPDSYGTVKGRAQIRNVFFDNFAGVNDCDQREVAFFQDFFSNDTFHQHTFENIQWGANVPAEGKFYYWAAYGDAKGTLTEDKQTTFLDFDDIKRGGFWPDAPYKVWLIDMDGSFSGTGKQQQIFGSRTMATLATFDQIGYSGAAFRNGNVPGALKPGCSFVAAWNAYRCEEKKYVSLTIESYADDKLTRRAGPLVMCKGDGMVAPNGWPLCQGGEADFASGPVSKGKTQRATLDRLSRYRFTVEVGHNYTLSTRGAPPTWIRMWLHGHEYTGLNVADIGVVVNMRYFGDNSRMRVGVYVDGVRKPQSMGFGNPYTISPATTFPMPTDPAGTHYHNLGFYDTENGPAQYNVMSTTLRPNVGYVDWKQEAIIIVTATVAMTEEDFFNNKATFALALASTLGIPDSRLKFAQIVAGTYSARRQLMAGSAVTVQFTVGVDETVLQNNAGVQTAAIGNDFPAILARVSSIGAGTTIGNVPVSAIGAETVSPQLAVPAPVVSTEYSYMVLNVTRDDGVAFNETYFVEHILAYTNSQLAPASGIKREIGEDELAHGNLWTFHDLDKTRITLFYTLEDDRRGSNILTSNLFQMLTSPAHAKYALPANHRIVDASYSAQGDSDLGGDGEQTLAAGFIILIVVGVLVVVGLLAVGVGYVVYQRRKAARTVPSFGDKDASVQEMKDLHGSSRGKYNKGTGLEANGAGMFPMGSAAVNDQNHA